MRLLGFDFALSRFLCPYAPPTTCPVLSYAMSGTDLRPFHGMPGTVVGSGTNSPVQCLALILGYGAMHSLGDVRYSRSVCCPIGLRACYAMSGTDIAYATRRRFLADAATSTFKLALAVNQVPKIDAAESNS
eukprot:3732073-Rhodomonas_salina.1